MDRFLEKRLKEFRENYPVDPAVADRITEPAVEFIGEEVVGQAVTALLDGENLLLAGNKATGKNILADNLAWMFGRPVFNMSFHVGTDSSSLIGNDTFVDNEVRLRKGPVTLCAEYGGFGILDEINMAKNDALAVLHAALDYRRVIDIPGYQRILLHPACRFIGTMNYGYAGTKELNEALVSRFLVIQMPALPEDQLAGLLDRSVPGARPEMIDQFTALFFDLQSKAKNGEISSHSVDLRGMLAALRMIREGLPPAAALKMGVVDKCFDEFEHQLVRDVVLTRFPEGLTPQDIFPEAVRREQE